MPRRIRLLLIIGSISILLDQVTKYWARKALADGPIVVVDGFWDFVLAWNYGAAFSMFESLGYGRILLSLVAAGAVGLIVHMVYKAKDEQTLFIWSLSLMAGGAVGNLIDRIAMGKVTDFVLWKYGSFHWPVFNVADIALVIAVGLFVIVAYQDYKEGKNSDAENDGGDKAASKA